MQPTRSLILALLRYALRPWLLDVLLWIFILAVFPALPGLLLRGYFDSLGAGGDTGPAIWIGALLAAGAAHIGFIVLGRFTKTQHRFLGGGLLRHNLLAGVLARPGAAALSVNGRPVAAGDALNTCRDDVENVEDLVVGISELAASGLFALVSLSILLRVNPLLTLLVFLPLLGIVALVRAVDARVKRYRAAGRTATAAVTGLIGELFGAVQAVQVAGAETALLRQLRAASERRGQAMVRDELFTTLLRSVFLNLVSLGTGLILLAIALLRWRGARPGASAAAGRTAGSGNRPMAETPGRRDRPALPLRLDLPDRALTPRSRNPLRRRQRDLPDNRRGPELNPDQPRPDPRRPRQAAAERRPA